MKKIISTTLSLIMIIALLPISSLAEHEEAIMAETVVNDKITADVLNNGADVVKSGDKSQVGQKSVIYNQDVYQRVSSIDDTSARYLIVYDGGSVGKALTARTTGDIQTGGTSSTINSTDINVEHINGEDANGKSNYYIVKTLSGTSMGNEHKWTFSSTTTAANAQKAHAMYVRNYGNGYYLQANNKVSGSNTVIDPTEYEGIGTNYWGYMFDKLYLTQSALEPVQDTASTPVPTPTTAPVTSFTINQIAQGAAYVANQYEDISASFPASVNIAGTQVTVPDYFILAAKAIIAINNGSTASTSIPYLSYSVPNGQSTYLLNSSEFSKTAYLNFATRQITYVTTGGGYTANPSKPLCGANGSYSTSTFSGSTYTGVVTYEAGLMMFARILRSYYQNNSLPSSVYIDAASSVSSTTFTVRQLSDAATVAINSYNSAIGSGTTAALSYLPANIAMGNTSLNRYTFFRMLNAALYDMYNSGAYTKTYSNSMVNTAPSDGTGMNDTVTSSSYAVPIVGIVNLASRLRNWFNSNTMASNYSTSIRNDPQGTTTTSGTQLMGGRVGFVRHWILITRTFAYYDTYASLPTDINYQYATVGIASPTPNPTTAVPLPTLQPVPTPEPTPTPTLEPLAKTENCINVIPAASLSDTGAVNGMHQLDDDHFMFTWYHDSSSGDSNRYYYKTSYLRFSDGRYNDRFVFSPSRVDYTQLMTMGSTANGGSTLAAGSRTYASDWRDGFLPLSEGFSSFLHFLRPSYMTIYKAVPSVSVTLDEAPIEELINEDQGYTAPDYGITAEWLWSETVYNAGAAGAEKIMNVYAETGITDVYLLVKGVNGSAAFNIHPLSGITSGSSRDILQEVITAAHSKGIRVHAWLMCMEDYSAGAKGYNYMTSFRTTQTNDSRVSFVGAYAETYLPNVVRDIVNNYDIDGVHLDAIRYNYMNNGIEAAKAKLTVAQYNEAMTMIASQLGYNTQLNTETGYVEWLNSNATPVENAAFNAFENGNASLRAFGDARADDVNALLQRIRTIVKADSQDNVLSVALQPEGAYNDAFTMLHYGQDFDTIGNYVDYVVPMAYSGTWSPMLWDGVATSAELWMRLVAANTMDRSGPTVMGIEAYDEAVDIDTLDMKKDIDAVRQVYYGSGDNIGVAMFRGGTHAYANTTVDRPNAKTTVTFANYNTSNINRLVITFPTGVTVMGHTLESGQLKTNGATVSTNGNVVSITGATMNTAWGVNEISFTTLGTATMKTNDPIVTAYSGDTEIQTFNSFNYIPLVTEGTAPLLDDPQYPEPGSVRIKKEAEGVNWEATGVAEVQLGVTGIGVREYTDFVLVLDRSGSMREGGDLEYDRLGMEKNAANAFLDTVLATKANGQASNNRVAIVSFGYYATQDHDFTNDVASLKSKINDITANGGTNYDEAFQCANAYLDSSTAKHKVIVFVTDGAPFKYNDTKCTSYWGVSYNGGAGTYNTDSIDPTYSMGNIIGGTYYASARISDFLRVSDYSYYEDYFAYSTMTTDHSSTVHGVGEAAMYRNFVANTSHFYSDESKELGYDVYTVGIDMSHDSSVTFADGEPYILFTPEECAHILTNMASDSDHYYNVDAADLGEAFQNIASGYLKFAGEDAAVTDVLGIDYSLQLANTVKDKDNNPVSIGINPTIKVTSYDLITQDMVDGTNITLDDVGSKTGDSLLLETVTFNAAGTQAYSDKISSGSVNILSNGIITAQNFTYDIASKTFVWQLGTIDEEELVLSYYVYLDGAIEGLRGPGTYDTNQNATLVYTNLNGNRIYKTFEKPKLPWGVASMTYEYYLVNANGQPVNREGTVVGMSSRITVYGPLSQEVYLNAQAGTNALAATANLPYGYTLHILNAEYEVEPVSAGSGSYAIRGTVPSGSVQSTRLINNTTGFTSSHIAFGVLFQLGLNADLVVIDWDKPVLHDVTQNDTIPNPVLVGIMTNTNGDDAATVNGVAINTGNTAAKAMAASTTKSGEYGTADVSQGMFKYTPMAFMDGIDRFFCCVSGNVDNEIRYFYSMLKVVPATNVYYEDTFTADTGDTSGVTGIYYSGDWTIIGTTQTGETQSGDQDPYGYDPSYNNDAADSNGSAHFITNTNTSGTTAIATFTFRGTGFDIIGRTSTYTGSIMYRVTDMEDNNKLLVSYVCNTVYRSGSLYQIPYLSWTAIGKGLEREYSTYKVELLAIGTPASPQRIYVDAIRIYNPLGLSSADNEDYESGVGAYNTQKEGYPQYFEIRQLFYAPTPVATSMPELATPGPTSTATPAPEDIGSPVFIDGNGSTAILSDAYKFGPKNEMYLGKNQSLALEISSDMVPASVQIGAKAPIPNATDVSEISFSQIVYAMRDVNKAYNASGLLVDSVTISGHVINMASLMKMASIALANASGGNTLERIAYTYCTEPIGGTINTFSSSTISMDGYLYLAARQLAFMNVEIDASVTNLPANYVAFPGDSGLSYTGEITYERCMAILSRVFDYYCTNGSLPQFVSAEAIMNVAPSPVPDPSPIPTPPLTSVTAKFTVGSSIAIQRSITISSATDMFYEITGGINFIKSGNMYTGSIIITNTSDTEIVVSLTKIKLTFNVSASGDIHITSNKNLIDRAIEITEQRKAGVGIADGVETVIIDDIVYENGKIIKPLYSPKVNKPSDTLFKDISKWFYSRLR